MKDELSGWLCLVLLVGIILTGVVVLSVGYVIAWLLSFVTRGKSMEFYKNVVVPQFEIDEEG